MKNSKSIKQQNPVPRIAVVGSGYWGKNLVRNFYDLKALEAVCETDPDKLNAIKIQYPGCRTIDTYEQVLNDATIEAIAIATPAESHAELVKLALSAGKDVY